MKKLLIAAALTVAVQASVATGAHADNYFFSFTSTNSTPPNVAGTVTGEIFGLQRNNIGPATDVEIFSWPSGLNLSSSLTSPIDVFTTATIGDNTFQTSGFNIVAAMFSASSPLYNLNIFLGPAPSLLQNPGPPTVLNTSGIAKFQVTPLPTALPLFATGLAALGLLAWRRKRKTTLSVFSD